MSKWQRRNPEAADRLAAERAAMTALSERVRVPVENLLTPDLVRRLVWDWTPGPAEAAEARVDAVLAEGGARPWQRQLTVPVLAAALSTAAAD